MKAAPRLNLRAGFVVAVEPGVYLGIATHNRSRFPVTNGRLTVDQNTAYVDVLTEVSLDIQKV